jgi:hypothetical protein
MHDAGARCCQRRASDTARAHTVPPLQVALDSLAAGMLVTLGLDTWRIAVGGIVSTAEVADGLTWA